MFKEMAANKNFISFIQDANVFSYIAETVIISHKFSPWCYCLQVLSGWPVHGRHRGIHTLTSLMALSPLIHESLVDMWDTVIPKLVQHLEGTVK